MSEVRKQAEALMRHHSVVAADVYEERRRQSFKVLRKEFDWDCAAPGIADEMIGVLGEEFGEVCKRYVIESEPLANPYSGLVQVAAVAIGWAEAVRVRIP